FKTIKTHDGCMRYGKHPGSGALCSLWVFSYTRFVQQGDKGQCAVPFANGLNVVIGTTGRFAATDETAFHLLLAALEEHAAEHVRPSAHHAPPPVQVVLVAREPVDEEEPFAAAARHDGVIHRVLQQVHGDLHRHDLALLDVRLCNHTT